MPYYIDMMLDTTKDQPTLITRATTGLIMEFRRWPDPAGAPVIDPMQIPPMRIVFRKTVFGGKYRNINNPPVWAPGIEMKSGNTTIPSTTATLIRFESTPGYVSGDPVQEVRIMLHPTPGNPHSASYPYDVQMRDGLGGPWKTWDPRVVPK